MTARVRDMIDTIAGRKAANNSMLAETIKSKLMQRGIDPNRLSAEANDDPLLLAKLVRLAKEL